MRQSNKEENGCCGETEEDFCALTALDTCFFETELLSNYATKSFFLAGVLSGSEKR